MNKSTYFDMSEVPIWPGITEHGRAKTRIENLYLPYELQEAGIDVDAELEIKTEQQVLDLIEMCGVEPMILPREVMHLLAEQDNEALSFVPIVNTEECAPFRETKPGYDESAFNTHDYVNSVQALQYKFDNFWYMTTKVFERGRDIAMMHSCVSQDWGKQVLRERFANLVNGKLIEPANQLRKEFFLSGSEQAAQHNANREKQLRDVAAKMICMWSNEAIA